MGIRRKGRVGVRRDARWELGEGGRVGVLDGN